ncbi:hypothetical protein C0J52_24308 [Blattella germanica]|nr:hypothetical protein C0J52_24308 [Blattella germanica]
MNRIVVQKTLYDLRVKSFILILEWLKARQQALSLQQHILFKDSAVMIISRAIFHSGSSKNNTNIAPLPPPVKPARTSPLRWLCVHTHCFLFDAKIQLLLFSASTLSRKEDKELPECTNSRGITIVEELCMMDYVFIKSSCLKCDHVSVLIDLLLGRQQRCLLSRDPPLSRSVGEDLQRKTGRLGANVGRILKHSTLLYFTVRGENNISSRLSVPLSLDLCISSYRYRSANEQQKKKATRPKEA